MKWRQWIDKILPITGTRETIIISRFMTTLITNVLNLLAVFPKVYDITAALLKSEIDGAFFDSFMITAYLNLIKDHPGLRVERTIEHPVTYGMVLAGNSSKMEACARRYVENYPRKVFQRIALHLKPLKVRHRNLWFSKERKSKKVSIDKRNLRFIVIQKLCLPRKVIKLCMRLCDVFPTTCQ